MPAEPMPPLSLSYEACRTAPLCSWGPEAPPLEQDRLVLSDSPASWYLLSPYEKDPQSPSVEFSEPFKLVSISCLKRTSSIQSLLSDIN